MSSLKNYVKGLKDTTWTDARAVKLDTVPDVGTWTDTRAGYLDALAGGSLGFKPIATYGYSASFNHYNQQAPWTRTFGVSVIDWTACFVNTNTAGGSLGRTGVAAGYLNSNTQGAWVAVKDSNTNYDINNRMAVAVTQFG